MMRDYSDKLKILSGEFLANRVKFNCPVSDLLLVKNQVKADGAFVAADEGELVKVLDRALELKIPIVILGTGLKYKFKSRIAGLLVADKTRLTKIVGIKGKVGGHGIGVDEASVEIASGEIMTRVNEFLDKHGLDQLMVGDNPNVTIGERVLWDENLRGVVEKIKIWDQGQVYRCNMFELNLNRHVVIGVIIKMKAK